MEVFARLAIDDSDEIRGTAGTLKDLTERVQAEDKLRKLSRAVEQSPNVTIIADSDLRVEYVNQKYTSRTGRQMSEVIEKTFDETGSSNSEEMSLMLNSIKSGEEKEPKKLAKTGADGKIYWELSSFSPIRASNGSITHCVQISQDITDRKRTELELLRS